MKKQLIILFIFFFVFAFSTSTMANTIEHDVNVSLASTSNKVNIGEKVMLSSIVPKHGNSFIDEWIGSDLISTKLEDDNYVSLSAFSSDKPGFYTITYNIKMRAGNGDTIFLGSKSLTIEVIDNKSIEEVGVKNLVISEKKNSEGAVISYYAIGTIFVNFSNGETMDYGTIFVGFSKDEFSKDVDITIDINGEKNIYTVNIKRF